MFNHLKNFSAPSSSVKSTIAYPAEKGEWEDMFFYMLYLLASFAQSDFLLTE